MSDAVNPKHYKDFSNGSEVIDIAEHLTFNAGNVIKYGARAGRFDESLNKNDLEGRIEDLKKARKYLDREIQRLGGELEADPCADLALIASQLRHPAYQDYEAILSFDGEDVIVDRIQKKGNTLNG